MGDEVNVSEQHTDLEKICKSYIFNRFVEWKEQNNTTHIENV